MLKKLLNWHCLTQGLGGIRRRRGRDVYIGDFHSHPVLSVHHIDEIGIPHPSLKMVVARSIFYNSWRNSGDRHVMEKRLYSMVMNCDIPCYDSPKSSGADWFVLIKDVIEEIIK